MLKEQGGDRALPIVIGEYEAQSIAMALEHIEPPRPITHDLAINMLKMLQVTLDSIIITELKDNTYYAVLRLVKDSEIIEVDSRPSDAIALAVRLDRDIFVYEEVMNDAAYVPDEEQDSNPTGIMSIGEDELRELKRKLQNAVEAEEYEEAARLRDRIKRLESGS